MPPCVDSARFFLARAVKKQPLIFELPMSISDLCRLMYSLGERFRMNEIDAMAKELGYDNPSDVVRRHCADFVKLETSDDKRAW